MKNILLAIGFLALGLGIGYLIFGNSRQEAHHHVHADDAPSKLVDPTSWTCAMHPQIQSLEPGLCPICEMDLVSVTQQPNSDPLVLEMTEAAVQLSNIQTTRIGTTDVEQKTLQLSGKIQADERRITNQVSHFAGRIEQLFVTFTGEQVRKGQKIATIYSPELITAQRELLEALKFKHMNPNLVTATRKKLTYWKIPESTIKEIEVSKKIQETFPLYAEYGGIVNKKLVAVGDHVEEGQALFQVLNLEKVWAVFDGYEEELTQIQPGAKVRFTSPGIPNKTFRTQINFIDPVIDAQTRVAAVRAEVWNKDGKLRPELMIKGTLEMKSSAKESLMVPKSAVLWTGKRSVVYVKVPDQEIPSFEYREVELGAASDNYYVIKAGLESGEEVVTNGSFSIDAAAQLNNQASMMNRMVDLKSEEPQGEPDFRKDTPAAFKQQLKQLVEAYLPLKDALVETDAEAAQQHIRRFQEQLSGVKSEMQGEPEDIWQQLKEGMQVHSQKLLVGKDIEVQRSQFSFLSDQLIQAVRYFGVGDIVLYLQHCPMAFDDTGADWLSAEERVYNPYFGDKMLKCGMVEETLTDIME